MEAQKKEAIEYVRSDGIVSKLYAPRLERDNVEMASWQIEQLVAGTAERQAGRFDELDSRIAALKHEMQESVAKTKAEHKAEIATAITKMAKEMCEDINHNTAAFCFLRSTIFRRTMPRV